MKLAWQYLCSVVFIFQMYLAMLVMSFWYVPWAIVTPKGATAGVRTYCRYVRWTAAWMVGLRTEVRGPVPQEECIVASKHQSFLDIIMLTSVLPLPKFIMKQELRWAPILGWFGKRIGSVPVDRGAGGSAVQQMIAAVQDPNAPPGQLIIYPQGTRVAPGAQRAYKIGVGALYEGLTQTVVPAATNVGVFWPRHGILRKPGLAVLEFLEPIEPGMTASELVAELEARIEPASDKLMRDAGFEV